MEKEALLSRFHQAMTWLRIRRQHAARGFVIEMRGEELGGGNWGRIFTLESRGSGRAGMQYGAKREGDRVVRTREAEIGELDLYGQRYTIDFERGERRTGDVFA